MNRVIVAPRTVAQQASQQTAKAAQQAALAALVLNRAGLHEQARAIWDAAKGALIA